MPFSPPSCRIALSHVGVGIGPRSIARIALAFDFDGVEVARRRMLDSWRGAEQFADQRFDDIDVHEWMRSASELSQRLRPSLLPFKFGQRRLIVRLADDPADVAKDNLVVRHVVAARTDDASATRITLAIPATVRLRGRTHLHRIRRVRAIAEEWDLDVALDLIGAQDRDWEAEAAIMLLGARLAYLRLRPPPAHPHGSIESDLVLRTLRAGADLGFAGTVAVAPNVPAWLRWSEREFGKRALQARADVGALLSGRPDSVQPTRFEEESNRA